MPERPALPRGVARHGGWFEPAVGDPPERLLADLAEAVARAFGVAAEIGFERRSPPVASEATSVALARAGTSARAGLRIAEPAEPVMAGEEIGVLFAEVPGRHLLPGAEPGLHRPDYGLAEAILPLGDATLPPARGTRWGCRAEGGRPIPPPPPPAAPAALPGCVPAAAGSPGSADPRAPRRRHRRPPPPTP